MAFPISHQGFIPSPSTQVGRASLEKGRQEREGKMAAQPSTPSTTVNISNEARAQIAAEKPGAQATKNSSAASSSNGTYQMKSGAVANSIATDGKPQNVKFGSVNEAIAYGTRKANEQAAANNKTQQGAGTANAPATSAPSSSSTKPTADTNAAAGANAASGKPQNAKFGSVDEAIAYGTRKANEQATAKYKEIQSTANAPATSAPFSSSTKPTADTNATAGANAASGKPQNVKFGSVDEAIAYGTRKANEQASTRSNAV